MNWDRVERLIGAGNLAVLAQKKVAVIGCGSGGGFVALGLAMSGVGSFILVDDDVLEETNIVRHVADRRYLGQPKADAVADLIRQRNPNAKVETRIGRLEANFDALEGVDLVISGIDNEPSKYVLNEAALARSLTTVYAGVYQRGEGGDVVIIHPYDGACYACWAEQVRDDLNSTKPEETAELDYGMIGKDGTLDAEPGLWLHVTRVAGAQAEIALNELLRETDAYRPLPGSTLILANTALEILEGQMSLPYSSVWVTIPRSPTCLVCGGHYAADNALEADDSAVSVEDLFRQAGLSVDDQDE